jgi:hypothetical protein
MDTGPECSTQAGPSISKEQVLDTLNTNSDNRCNLELPGTTETERQNSRNEEDGKCCDEQYIGPNSLQQENPKTYDERIGKREKDNRENKYESC